MGHWRHLRVTHMPTGLAEEAKGEEVSIGELKARILPRLTAKVVAKEDAERS